ncbi:MAG: DUF4832 domain-containing protein [Lacunisphaera sp.]|nr:DUF4832 domain-containing protein [Lacunisphaera sp.]
MKPIRIQTTVVATLLALAFSAPAHAEETRVQAEDMALADYQVERGPSEAFIKLTAPRGVARFRFALPSGRYDLDARYLSEKVGQNTYAVYLNDQQIISWLGKDRDDRWHLLSEQKWHVPRNLAFHPGDEIRIETLSGTGSLAVLDYLVFTPAGRIGAATKQSLVTVQPEEYGRAFRNPLKGFRPGFGKEQKQPHEYGTLAKTYFRWNELENAASDGVAKITAVCDARWQGGAERNIKFIPRVYLTWPRRESGWPADLPEGNFTSEQFKQRALALIKKLGQAWDNDSRVAFVEMGLIGEWGEMEWPDTTDEIKEAIAAQFANSFKNKLVMVRWPNTYNDDIYNFGYYWDSWAHHDQRYYAFNLNHTAPRWKTAVMGGEVAYDWGNSAIQPGKSPDESLVKPVHRDFVLDDIRKLHANHVGWIANYDPANATARAGAEIVQKALGYRFVVSEVTYPKHIAAGTAFTVSFKVKNMGSSPFYYNWPVEVSLLDPKTKQPVWQSTYADVDIRKWLPGDQWDDQSDKYALPPETSTVNQAFVVSSVPPGEYILALAILDPAGGRPNARFAIKNYYNGGRHPIGRVGLDRTIDSFAVSGFDDIQSDDSLSYDKVVK